MMLKKIDSITIESIKKNIEYIIFHSSLFKIISKKTTKNPKANKKALLKHIEKYILFLLKKL